MTEVVRKGIQEAQDQLQKANEERLLEEVRFPSQGRGCTGQGAQRGRVTLTRGYVFSGSVAADPCSRIRAELVFSSTSFTKGKNI